MAFLYNFPPMTPSSLCLYRCLVGRGIFPRVLFQCSSGERPCIAQPRSWITGLMWEALNYVIQHILFSFSGGSKGTEWSSFSLGVFWDAALIWEQRKSCNSGLWPRNTCKREGNPSNICASDLHLVTATCFCSSAFLLLLSFCWGKSSRQRQCHLQDFKYPLLSDLKPNYSLAAEGSAVYLKWVGFMPQTGFQI